MEKTVAVTAIKEGTVIDHIPAGQALKIVHLLKLSESQDEVTLGLHFRSSSKGSKDIMKIKNRYLSKNEAHYIAVFAPHATINIIKNYKVASKITAELPHQILRILVCPNPRCITNQEPIETQFQVQEFKHIVFLCCYYCEKNFARDEIKKYNV